MLIARPADLLLPLPVYLLAGLVGLTAYGFRRRATAPGRWRTGPYLLLGVTLWAWVVSTPAVADRLYRELEGPPENPADRPVARDPRSLVVVLASGQLYGGDGKPHPRLDAHGWERTVEGIALWKRTGGTLLFCGGPAEGASLAAAMRRIAIDMGVPPQAIRTVSTSRNTREDLLHARGFVAGHAGPVWLVTSALHMPRALAVARRLDFEVRAFPVDYRQILARTWKAWLPHNTAPQRLAPVLHELGGRLSYRLRGWAD